MAGVCGRDCENCQERSQWDCRGCIQSEGNPYWGKCAVVQCCHGRGLSACADCQDLAECERVKGAGEDCAAFIRHQEEERQQAEVRLAERRKNAPILAKWLPVLFWCIIVNVVATGLENLHLGMVFSRALEFLKFLMGVVPLAAYWKFSKISPRFRTLFLYEVVLQGMGLFVLIVGLIGGSQTTLNVSALAAGMVGGLLLVSVALLVLGLVIIYFFCEAMAEQVDGLEQGLADNWRLLRKWELGLVAGFAVALLAALMGPALGVILLLFVALGTLICGICNLVLLWKSAALFQALSAESALE